MHTRNQALHILLRYLKGSPGKGISIIKSKVFDLMGYVDTDWAMCLVSRRFVTRYFVYLGKSIVSRSFTKSEYMALGSITCEIMWVLKILFDLGIKEFVKLCGC